MSFILVFMVGAALGSYVQTTTGFAQGIVVTGVVALVGSASVAATADALNLIGIFNAAVVLPKLWEHIDWRRLLRIMITMVPGMVAGVILLGVLSVHHSLLLRLLAGVVVFLGGASLIARPRPAARSTGWLGTGLYGVTAGLMSGLFSLPGPPVVYYYYRLPVPLPTIRSTLIAIFALLSVLRLMTVAWHGEIGALSLQAAAASIPVVAVCSWLGVHFPPRLSDTAARRLAFAILAGMGTLTILMALPGVFVG